jgi:hypothetical protein
MMAELGLQTAEKLAEVTVKYLEHTMVVQSANYSADKSGVRLVACSAGHLVALLVPQKDE